MTNVAWPSNLSDLLNPTPSGVSKLIAAWDGLSLELQVEALSRITQHPAYLSDRLLIYALGSGNAYVRYIAAKHLRSHGDKSPELVRAEAAIHADPNPLVRFAQLERDWALRDLDLKDSKRFFELPHEARLAKVRALTGASEGLALIVLDAAKNLVPTGAVTELELYEILSDYILKPEFQNWYGVREGYARQFGDGYAEHSAGRDLESLWSIVPEVPEGLARLLIAHLPIHAGFSSNFAAKTAAQLPENLLIQLFYRPAGLADIRESIFLDKSKSENLRSAAVCYDYSPTYEKFDAMLFDLSPFKKIGLKGPDLEDPTLLAMLKDLRILAMYAHDLDVVVQQALVDFLRAAPLPRGTIFGGPQEDAGFAQDELERKLSNSTLMNRYRVRDLRIYFLARSCVSWRSGEPILDPPNDLVGLRSKIDPHSTWRTFVGFRKEWIRRIEIGSELEKHLPEFERPRVEMHANT